MKKTTKYIIITLVVLIVLGAAAAALILTSPKDSEDDANSSSTVSESTEPALIDKTAEDVKNIGIEDLTADDQLIRSSRRKRPPRAATPSRPSPLKAGTTSMCSTRT